MNPALRDPGHQSPWPRRTAWATALLTMPLLLLGGTVTTLRVGMAVPDWPTTFGHNMFTYPLTEMLQNSGVSWEHTHRLYASFVGLCVIALCTAHLVWERRPLVRKLAVGSLVFVILQGVVGGFRVLQNAPQLAFLHGALAQAFFALVGAIAVMHLAHWKRAERRACKRAGPLHKVALATTGLVFVQIVLGAWLRHSGNLVALALHVVVAALSAGAVVVLARELRLAAEEGTRGGHDRGVLLRLRRQLVGALAVQLVLGVLAAVWVYVVTGPHNPVSVGEAVFATAHVLVGALLLWATVASTLFAHRLISPRAADHVPAGTLEGAP